MFDKEQIELQRRILAELRAIRRLFNEHYEPTHFRITGDCFMAPIAPGFSPVFTATPEPSGALISPTQAVPVWESSDPANAPVVADPTGLTATVAIASTAPVGASVTLTVSYTRTDSVVASGTLAITIVAAPVEEPTSFTIDQTA